MTSKSDFTQEEWARVVRAPLVAGLAITVADPGGPFEAAKETVATLKSATNPPSRQQLLAEVALELQALTQQHQNPLKGYKPTKDKPVGDQVLDELRDVRRSSRPRPSPPRPRHSASGWSPRPGRPPTRPRTAASWASARTRSASASRRWSTRCAQP